MPRTVYRGNNNEDTETIISLQKRRCLSFIGDTNLLFSDRCFMQVVLECEYCNTIALQFYSRFGFMKDKRLNNYYLNGNDAFRLKLLFPNMDDAIIHNDDDHMINDINNKDVNLKIDEMTLESTNSIDSDGNGDENDEVK